MPKFRNPFKKAKGGPSGADTAGERATGPDRDENPLGNSALAESLDLADPGPDLGTLDEKQMAMDLGKQEQDQRKSHLGTWTLPS